MKDFACNIVSGSWLNISIFSVAICTKAWGESLVQPVLQSGMAGQRAGVSAQPPGNSVPVHAAAHPHQLREWCGARQKTSGWNHNSKGKSKTKDTNAISTLWYEYSCWFVTIRHCGLFTQCFYLLLADPIKVVLPLGILNRAYVPTLRPTERIQKLS